MIRTKKRMALCLILLAALLAFIWGNSMASGARSGAASGRIVAWINSFLHFENAEALHLAVRKMAHFTEFTCLGLVLGWLFAMMGEKKGHLFWMPLFCGLLAACVDESIQLFTPDRGSSLIDVWIDTAGVCAGIILFLIGHHYIRKRQMKKNLEETI